MNKRYIVFVSIVVGLAIIAALASAFLQGGWDAVGGLGALAAALVALALGVRAETRESREKARERQRRTGMAAVAIYQHVIGIGIWSERLLTSWPADAVSFFKNEPFERVIRQFGIPTELKNGLERQLPDLALLNEDASIALSQLIASVHLYEAALERLRINNDGGPRLKDDVLFSKLKDLIEHVGKAAAEARKVLVPYHDEMIPNDINAAG